MTALENIAWFPRTEEPRSSQRNTWNNQVRNHAVMRGDQVAEHFIAAMKAAEVRSQELGDEFGK